MIRELTQDSVIYTEGLIVGAIFHDPSLANTCELRPEDFLCDSYRDIYSAFEEVIADTGNLSVDSVLGWLETHRPATTNWADHLVHLVDETYATPLVESYSKRLRELARSRRAKAILRQAIDEMDFSASVDPLIEKLMALDGDKKQYDYSLKEALKKCVDEIDAASQGHQPGVSSGFLDIDEKIGNFRNGDLVVIGARPAMGKTALLLNMARASNVPTGIISAEQCAIQAAMRMLSAEMRIPLTKLRTGKLEDHDGWPKLTTAVAGDFGKLPIRIYDRPAPTVIDVVKIGRQWKHRYGIKALYVDYIQRIKGRATDNRVNEVSEIAQGLKELARTLDLPVIALSQVNRKVEERSNKRPQLNDLSDSSAIEKEADVVFSLYRDEVYNDNSPDKGTAELSCLKNRHGPTGTSRVAWRGDIVRFDNFFRDRNVDMKDTAEVYPFERF